MTVSAASRLLAFRTTPSSLPFRKGQARDMLFGRSRLHGLWNSWPLATPEVCCRILHAALHWCNSTSVPFRILTMYSRFLPSSEQWISRFVLLYLCCRPSILHLLACSGNLLFILWLFNWYTSALTRISLSLLPFSIHVIPFRNHEILYNCPHAPFMDDCEVRRRQIVPNRHHHLGRRCRSKWIPIVSAILV